MDGFIDAFNLFEALWWGGIGGAVWCVPFRPDAPRLRKPLAAALFVFGLSDLVELWSGAWWKPWWLAVVKTACVVAIAWLVWAWFRVKAKQSRDRQDAV